MKITVKGAASALAAVPLSLAVASSANAMLVNGSFENPDASGGDVSCSADWNCFNANFTSSNSFRPGGGFANPGANDGVQVLKQFGADGGAFQDITVAAGDTVDASAYALSWSGDQFNNLAILQLSFFDAAGNGVGGPIETFCDSVGGQACTLAPQDGGDPAQWTQMAVSGVAPTGAASARLLLLHVLTDGTPAGGALFWDNASLTATGAPPPPPPPPPVPVPAAAWLFGSALLGLAGAKRRKA